MSYENWLNYLKRAQKNSMISGQCRKIFYKFPDGHQMAEEYSMETGIIQKRAWRKCKQLMGEPEWEMELGEDYRQLNNGGDKNDTFNNPNKADSGLMVEVCTTEPILSKRITKKNIEWRIRNMPYPIDVYQVNADVDKKAIVIKTTNKKYYKIIKVPELDRCGLVPTQADISISHQYNTLIITYRKPPLLNEMEAQVLLMLKDVPTETDMEEILQGLLKK